MPNKNGINEEETRDNWFWNVKTKQKKHLNIITTDNTLEKINESRLICVREKSEGMKKENLEFMREQVFVLVVKATVNVPAHNILVPDFNPISSSWTQLPGNTDSVKH